MMNSSPAHNSFAPIAMLRKGLFLSVAFAASSFAQTFEIGGQQSQPAQPTPQQHHKAGKSSSAAAASENSQENALQFGVSLEATREQRAADEALRHNNTADAYTHAKRAVDMAPGDK